jgi:integrase
MFSKAVEWQFLEDNTLRVVKKFKEPPGRTRWFTLDEAQRLIANLEPHLIPIVITLLNTGMRKGEALRLEWKDVDLTNRMLTVRTSKNNESRTLPINQVLFDLFTDLKRKAISGYVFCHENGSPYREIYYGVKSAEKRAGILDADIHTCRHTFASWLAMKGVDIRVIQVLMGHKTIAMTMRYAHLGQKTLQDAVSKLNENIIQNDRIKHKSVPKHGTLLAQS